MKKYFLKDINKIDLKEYNRIFEINKDCDFTHYVDNDDDYEYWIIENFLVNPEEVNEFILNNFIHIERDGKLNPSHHPAEQISFPQFTFFNIKEYLFDVLTKKMIVLKTFEDFHGEFESKQERLTYLDGSWDTYSNLAYKNVKVKNRNFEPHTDAFTLACNLFLTDNAVGTNLYKKKYGNHLITSGMSGFAKFGKAYTNHMERYMIEREKDSFVSEQWINVSETKDWLKYHTIPGKFNSVSIYRGTNYHSPNLTGLTEDNEIRHNLVFGYNPLSLDEREFDYQSELNKWEWI